MLKAQTEIVDSFDVHVQMLIIDPHFDVSDFLDVLNAKHALRHPFIKQFLTDPFVDEDCSFCTSTMNKFLSAMMSVLSYLAMRPDEYFKHIRLTSIVWKTLCTVHGMILHCLLVDDTTPECKKVLLRIALQKAIAKPKLPSP